MLIFFYIFILSLIIQLFYYLFIFNKLISFKSNKTVSKLPISVLICAKDEAKNLQTFLPYIYKQKYNEFEVVLIDDRSIDETWKIMENFKEKYPNKTKVVRIDFSDNPRFVANKKYALTLGIKAANYNHLLFTDADCKPLSENWIAKMGSGFNNYDLILGYGKYRTEKSFLNKIIRYETVQAAIQYLSYALTGNTYMGVGRNLAYSKKLFFDNNGFYNHLDILSGDDDLFVNEASTNKNTTICIDNDSFTESIPKQTWKEWIYQKRRHISTAKHYKMKHKILLSAYYFSLAIFYFTTILLLIRLYKWKIVAGLVFIRFIYWFYIQYKTQKKLNEKGLLFLSPVLEILLLILQFGIFIVNLIHKPALWKK